MTVTNSPTATTHRSHDHNTLISLCLLIAAFLPTFYSHITRPSSHKPCAPLKNVILGLAVILAYLAAVGIYTSPDGKVIFPIWAVCYFGVLSAVLWEGVKGLRAALGIILGVEVGVVGDF